MSRYLYNPSDSWPFRISRSKIDLFLKCPRCFYLDRKLGIKRPSFPPFTLNSAVDNLLKNEFDLLRKNGQRHKLMEKYGIEAFPYNHPNLSEWRDDHYNYVGASVLHQPTNLQICGIIDDIWVNNKKELIIVDYKATSTSKEISLDDNYKKYYKRQVEIYQWIFREKGFKVSDMSYFVFANADRNRPEFDGKLNFKLSIVPYEGDASWVENTIFEIKKYLDSPELPTPAEDCEYCNYRRKSSQKEKF